MGAFLSVLPLAGEVDLGFDLGLTESIADGGAFAVNSEIDLTSLDEELIRNEARWQIWSPKSAHPDWTNMVENLGIKAITERTWQSTLIAAAKWEGENIAVDGSIAVVIGSAASGGHTYYDFLYNTTHYDYLYSDGHQHPSESDYLYGHLTKDPVTGKVSVEDGAEPASSASFAGPAVFDDQSVFLAITNHSAVFNMTSLLAQRFELASFDHDSGTGKWRYADATAPSGNFTGFFYETETKADGEIVVVEKQKRVDWHLNGTLDGVAPDGKGTFEGRWLGMVLPPDGQPQPQPPAKKQPPSAKAPQGRRARRAVGWVEEVE